MSAAPSSFHPVSVTDTCSVWNLLSSPCLLHRFSAARCSFCITSFVLYECLHKPRTRAATGDEADLMEKLCEVRTEDKFRDYSLSIEDLQDVVVLERRRNLGKGELSSMVFARKTRQAFLTDDRKARRFASEVLGNGWVQTVVQLVGWMVYAGHLTDSEVHQVLDEHEACGRPLRSHMKQAYEDAMGQRLADRSS